jgi:hypothetical protein
MNTPTTLEDRAAAALVTIVSLAGEVVAHSLLASSERLAGLKFIVGSYTPLVLEVLADPEAPDSLIFRFPELHSSRSKTLAPPADWGGLLVRGEHQYVETTKKFSLEDVAQVLSMRYHYLVKVEQEDSDNEAALKDPMMAARVLQRDFPDFESNIRLVPGHGLCFVIDGYSYVDLRKIIASLTWIRV